MTKLNEIIKVIEEFAPLSLQGDFDNCGLKIGDNDMEITGVLVTLDTNIDIVKEAIAKNCNLIIEHHPSIFYPIKSIDYNLPLSKAIVLAIKNDIAIYSAHTNVDFTENGLNDYVAKKIGLTNIYSLSKSGARMGNLESTTLKELAGKLKILFDDKNIKTIGNEHKIVNKVAIINGGGGGSTDELLNSINEGCDIFITSDVKYSVSRLAKDFDYGIIEYGHYTSEQDFLPLMRAVLYEKLKINIYLAEKQTNPYNC